MCFFLKIECTRGGKVHYFLFTSHDPIFNDLLYFTDFKMHVHNADSWLQYIS